MLIYNYFLFDAAKANMGLYKAQELNPSHQSLYKGRAEEDLAGVAPYLFSIKENTPFADWFFKEGWNESWGTLLFANAAFEDVYRHFRKFLMVKTEEGKNLYFRFYDPRVLRIFLPTCDTEQLRELFGPVRHFITESENKTEVIQFWLENAELKSKILPLLTNAETEHVKVEDMKPAADNTRTADTNNDSGTIEKSKKKWKFYLDE